MRARAVRAGASSAPRKSRRRRPGRRRILLPRPPERRHPSSLTRLQSRFLLRCLPAPASPTSSSATGRTPWTSGSSTCRAPVRCSSPAREARTLRPRTRATSLVSRATTRANGRPFSSGRFAPASGAAFSPESSCPWRSRSGMVSRANAGTGEVSRSGTHSMSSRRSSHRPSGPMLKTALLILVIELAVIGWVRRRARTRARTEELGGEPTRPAATTA